MNDKSNNLKGKVLNLFKKDSFYVVLFISLCLIAIVTAVAVSTNKANKIEVAKEDKPVISQEASVKVEEKYEIAKSGKTLEEGEAAVIQASAPDFQKPVLGEVVQSYSDIPVLAVVSEDKTSKTYKTNLGINYEAKVGEKVTSAAEGTVDYIGDNPKGFGYMVVIAHKNGYKSVYANLDKNVSVKLNQKVAAGQKVGVVGNTSLRNVRELKPDMSFLHFACVHGEGDFIKLDTDNSYLDPSEFIEKK